MKPFTAALGFLGWLCPRKINLKISLIPENDLLRLAKSQLTTSWYLKRGFDETSNLKPGTSDSARIDKNF
jgi:hypothetical protein